MTRPSASTTYSTDLPSQQYAPTRGICSLSHPSAGSFQFRTNPNEITWTYRLNTKVENTYGGRVVQILSTSIDDLTVKVDCGRGGWPYLMKVCQYFRDLLVEQRKGEPASFRYTTRGWHMNVYAVSIPFQDSVDATVRELTLNFKVQEDVSGIVSGQTLAAELKRVHDGIGFRLGDYNSPAGNYQDSSNQPQTVSIIGSMAGMIPTMVPGPNYPGIGSITSLFGGI
jgi:hypothetical protein